MTARARRSGQQRQAIGRPQIITSILVEGSVEHTRTLARRAAMLGADWIELRLDAWRPEAGRLDDSLEQLMDATALPVVVSCRTPEDGGAYSGTLEARRDLFQRALDCGADAIDLELWEEWAPQSRHMVIRSHHDFRGVTEDLPSIRDRLLDAGDVAKVVCMAHDFADARPLLELLAASDPEREPTVAFAMGERAASTRVLSAALGAPYVYTSVGAGAETAPGQLSTDLMAGLYHVHELGLASRIGGVLGDPARHSLGPWLHNRALRTAGIDGVYVALETSRPLEALAALPRRRLYGFSVTAPHKQSAVRLCHRLTPAAEAVGAVNTMWTEAHGAWVGDNTDVIGVVGALRGAGLAEVPAGRTGVVLGSGGAARAGAIALRELGLRVMILARTLEGIRDFARVHGFVVGGLRDDVMADTDPLVVVHATPVGGLGGPPGRLLPSWVPAPGTFVLDMVYQPRETELLRDVTAAGGVAVPGIEMFLAQAVAQIERFTGRATDRDKVASYLAGLDANPGAGGG